MWEISKKELKGKQKKTTNKNVGDTNFSKSNRTEEMTQSVQCLQGPEFDQENSHFKDKSRLDVCACNPSAGKAEVWGSWYFLGLPAQSAW